jgi:hypothetical protein
MCVKEGDKKKNLDYATLVCYMPLEDHTFDMSLNKWMNQDWRPHPKTEEGGGGCHLAFHDS